MNTSYPHHHSHSHETLASAVRPLCTYCLHRLGAITTSTPMSAAKRRQLVEDHQCVEKVIARQPHVALPFN